MAAQFTIRRKVFTLFGAKFHVYNAEGELLLFCNQKAFKLKEDIRLYTDESKSVERLRIAARQMLDISAAYDVFDSSTDEKLGTLRRQGLKSMFRDEWAMLDENEQEIGRIREDSMAMALLRRVIAVIPQKFTLQDQAGTQLAGFRTHFNPFVHKLTVTVNDDFPFNPMLVIAGGVLLVAIEGRQK